MSQRPPSLEEVHRAWKAAPGDEQLREQYLTARERAGLEREPAIWARAKVISSFRDRIRTPTGKPKKSLDVRESENVIAAWLLNRGWGRDLRATKDVWISSSEKSRVTFLRRNVIFEVGGRGRWQRDMRIHTPGAELLTKKFAQWLIDESRDTLQGDHDTWAKNPGGDWYAEATRANDEALRAEATRGLLPAITPPGSIVFPDGSRYQVLWGDRNAPSQGLLLWRADGLEAVMVEPSRPGFVRVRQGTVNVEDELAVTKPQGWQLTLAVLDMISRSATEERGAISQWATGLAAQPVLDMVSRYGFDAIGMDWEVELPDDDQVILGELSLRGAQ